MYRNDIFTPGKEYYQFDGENFNTKWGLNPGDVVGIKAGFYPNIDLGLGVTDGITFVNDGGVAQIGWFGLGAGAKNCKMLGNGVSGLKYGFKLTDKDHFALSWGCVGDLEAAFIEVDGASMGVQLVTLPGVTYPLNYQRLYAHDLLIQRTLNEAMYLGYVHDSPIPMDLKIERVTIIDSGRDGIQTRNTGSVLIQDCTLDGIGLEGNSDHAHGILFGSNSNGGTVKNCKVKRVAGCGIWNGGWGDFNYECNEIQAQAFGIMSRSSEGDVQNIGRQSQVIKNNKIYSAKSIECYYSETGKKISVDIENNQVSGTINIADGITKTLVNNGPNVVPDCGSSVPPEPTKELFHRGYFSLTSGKRFYYIMYSDNTWIETDGRYRPK